MLRPLKWKGFDFVPEGCLLDQFIEESSPMGVAYERSCQFYKDFHNHDRPILIFPRASCSMRVRTRNPNGSYLINERTVLLVPEGVEHDDEGVSSIYDTFALLPERRFIEKLAAKKGRPNVGWKVEKFARSEKLDYLLQEYFFLRIVLKQPVSEDGEFLEKKIISELFLPEKAERPQRFGGNEAADPLTKAVKFIESNLFSELAIQIIVKNSGTSQASLFRLFQAQMGCSPYSYIKSRRLDEARNMLRRGQTTVSDVASLVGYSNFGAFTDAYKSRFKRTPSSDLKKHK